MKALTKNARETEWGEVKLKNLIHLALLNEFNYFSFSGFSLYAAISIFLANNREKTLETHCRK